MKTEADRIRRLERAVALLGAGFAIASTVAVLALVRARSEESPKPSSEISIDGLTVSKWGLDVKNEVSAKTQSEAKLEATSDASYLALGVGKFGLTIEANKRSNNLRFAVLGNVESTIEVNTDTGAWTLVRTLHDAKYNVTKEDRLPLVGALQP